MTISYKVGLNCGLGCGVLMTAEELCKFWRMNDSLGYGESPYSSVPHWSPLAEPRFSHFGRNTTSQYDSLENCCFLMGNASECKFWSLLWVNSSLSWLDLVSAKPNIELFTVFLRALAGVALCTWWPQAIDLPVSGFSGHPLFFCREPRWSQFTER